MNAWMDEEWIHGWMNKWMHEWNIPVLVNPFPKCIFPRRKSFGGFSKIKREK